MSFKKKENYLVERSFLLLNKQITEMLSPSLHLVTILSTQNTVMLVRNVYNYFDRVRLEIDCCFKIDTGMPIKYKLL